MKKKIIFSLATSVFLLVLGLSAASAMTRVPGVAAGNSFSYADLSLNWYSNDTNATLPSSFHDFNETQMLNVTITDVQGTNITAHEVQSFKNGTYAQSDGFVDVETGEGINLTVWVIAADLNAGDTIYNMTGGAYSGWVINDTVYRMYPDGLRQTNHINSTMTEVTENQTLSASKNFYWDRLTGVMVEESWEFSNQTGIYLTTFSLAMRITSSNLWIIPEYPTCALVLIFLVTVTSAIVIQKRTQFKTQIS
jgi:hypothetical protein